MLTPIVTLICLLGIALSLKSALVAGGKAPWTAAGWWLTIVYLIAVIAKTWFGYAVPGHAEYVVLGALTIAFVIAGVRDEPQAEPWWWPVRRGDRRADKRLSGGS